MVENHELRRILKTGKVMECLKKLCGATDTTVFVADGRQEKKGPQNSYGCKSCYTELEKVVNLKAKIFELESGLKQKRAALYQNVFDNEMPRCNSRCSDVLEGTHLQTLPLAREDKKSPSVVVR